MGDTEIQKAWSASSRSERNEQQHRQKVAPTHGIQTRESPATADGRKLGPTVTTGTLSNEIVHLKDTPECSLLS